MAVLRNEPPRPFFIKKTNSNNKLFVPSGKSHQKLWFLNEGVLVLYCTCSTPTHPPIVTTYCLQFRNEKFQNLSKKFFLISFETTGNSFSRHFILFYFPALGPQRLLIRSSKKQRVFLQVPYISQLKTFYIVCLIYFLWEVF